MMLFINTFIAAGGLLSLGLAAVYSVLTLLAVATWRHMGSRVASRPAAPVSVLKPLCNDEPHLYEHLRTFCQQDFADFQLVFGVRHLTDPALQAVRRLVSEFPQRQIDVVVDPALHGKNFKISNLINMLAHARHDVLVVADSDTWVGEDYLASVTTPLQNPAIGLVTCIYRGVPTSRIASRLGAMYVNEWYMPSVLLARLFGFEGYVSGQTLCLRRDTLEAIGGLQAVANHLADDFRLGELVRGLGLKILMSKYHVAAQHDERDMVTLIRHELRWMRTLRVLRPRSFAMLFLSFSLPMAVAGMLMSLAQPAVATGAWVLLGITVVARLLMNSMHRAPAECPLWADLWLLPVRELLILGVWCGSFFTSRVQWRGIPFDVDGDGTMR
jgi:ceramide glucosyltransferase